MPIGPTPVGFAAFLLVKLGGYTGAAQMLGKAYDLPTGPWKAGAVRTAIGVGTGLAYFGAWELSGTDPSAFVWFVGLLPIRIFEWGLLLRLFFDRTVLGSSRSWKYSVFGTAWSYGLDVIGVGAALVIPGGVWVC